MQDKVVVVHQPDFIPYLGFFDRLLHADIFVVLDTVQYEKQGWMNRDKIKTAQGEQWLTVGVKKAPTSTPVNEILLSEDNPWRRKGLNLVEFNYKKSEFYPEIMPHIREIFEYPAKKMMDFNMFSIRKLMELFDIDIEVVFAHTLNPQGKNNELNIDIVNKLGAHRYLSGIGAVGPTGYHKQELYDQAGVEVIWQDFEHPVYSQLYGEFIPYLSSIDLLFNCGIKESRKILRGEII